MLLHSRRWVAIAFAIILLAQLTGVVEVGLIQLIPPLKKLAQQGEFGPSQVKAAGRYNPTGGILKVGTETDINSVSYSGNTGSWRGTLAYDDQGWRVSSTVAAGLNQILYLDNVELNNANKLIVTIAAGTDYGLIDRYYQICDWVSGSKVDNNADDDCTGGGWRTLNKATSVGREPITMAGLGFYFWQIYNGYWNGSTGVGVPSNDVPNDTPLSNFVSSTGRIMIRAYSPTTADDVHIIDVATVDLVVDPVYFPAQVDLIGGHNLQTGNSSYVLAQNPPTYTSGETESTGSDNNYLQVSGTVADFFMRFKDVRTYTGANAITVVAEYGCSDVGISHRPKIYNFYSSAWEDLTTTSIACDTTDATGRFGFSTSSLWKYIQDGEVRVGWYGLDSGTQSIRLDYIYIIVGSTVTDTDACEISFGTGVTTQCDRTNDLDSTLASTTGWMVASELESNTFSHDFYAQDNDNDNAVGEAAVATHITFPVRVPSTATLTSIAYSVRATPGSAYVSLVPQLKDWWGLNSIAASGYLNVGNIANASTTYGYTDVIDSGFMEDNAQHYINSYNDTITMRFRTGASTLKANFTRTFDWAMVSIRWVEEAVPRRTLQYQYIPTNGRLQVGTEAPILAGKQVGNVASWRGTLYPEASDGVSWTVTTSNTGLNQQLDFDYVKVNNANKMVITVYASSSNANLLRYYQICDWATTTAVDTAADYDCTGGWRTLNKVTDGSRVGIGETTRRTYTWHIYDGYWNKPNGAVTSTVNQVATTSLSNFVSSTNGTVRIRAYSTSTVYTTHLINYAGLTTVVDPIYFPQGLSVITGQSTGLSGYVNAQNPSSLISGSGATTGSDNSYARASGTASVTPEFYLVFRDVRTYPGANAILVVAETGCDATGIAYKMEIYNFSTASWELITAASACAASDKNNRAAINNVDLTNYVSNGEVRVGLVGTANGTNELRVDWMYIMVGTTNSDATSCRIDYGTNNAGDCTYTREISNTYTVYNWSVSSSVESVDAASDYYVAAGDRDGIAEHITSVYVPFTLTMSTGTSPAGMAYAALFLSGGTGKTMLPQLLDFSTPYISNWSVAGFRNIGTTNAATTSYTYTDAITAAYIFQSPENFINPVASSVVMRLRTSSATYTDTVTAAAIDFLMVSYRWVEDPNSTDITLTAADSTVTFDGLVPGTPVASSESLTVNTSNGTGYTIYLNRNDADTTMDLSTNAAINITDKTAWIAPGVTTTAGNAEPYTGTGLAFRLIYGSTDSPLEAETWWGNSDAEDANTLYAGIPTTSQAIAISSIPTTIDGNGTKVGFRLDVPSTQRTGVYDGTVTFTATVNP